MPETTASPTIGVNHYTTFIGGEWVDSDVHFEIRNPANEELVATVAKGGVEEGVDGLAESQIIAPSGQIVAKTATRGDEVVVAVADLEHCRHYTETLFDFDQYRMPEHYGLITERRGVGDGSHRD